MWDLLRPLIRVLSPRAPAENTDALRRGRDRVESVIGALILVAVLVLVPSMALAVGRTAYSDGLAEFRQQASELRETQATLLQSSPPQIDAQGRGSEPLYVRASASVDTGTARPETMQVWTKPGHTKGDEVTVWLDRSGEPAKPPVSISEAKTRGWTVGLGVLLLGGVAGVALRTLLRHVMIWTALPVWEREWNRVGPDWTQ